MALSPNSGWRSGRLVKVNEKYDAVLAGGFPVTLGGVAETLQCRNELDRTNWLTLIGICKEAIDLEAGDAPIAVPIRCTSNRSYIVSYSECLAIMKDLRSWAASAQANHWRLKDAVRDALTLKALLAIDLAEGWP